MRRSLLYCSSCSSSRSLMPAAAGAGGFATAGLSSTPEGVAPGQPWKVDITVLQHGRTPLDGLQPRVRIRSGDTTREFAAAPTGKTGVYRAEVVFPTAGRWDYEVLDGFIDEMPHTFPAVQIGGDGAVPAAAAQSPAARRRPPADDGGIAAGWLLAAGAALAARGRAARARPAAPPAGRDAGDAGAGVRPATVAAGVLVIAAAGMAVAALRGRRRRRPRSPRPRARRPPPAAAAASAARGPRGLGRAGLRRLPHVRRGQQRRPRSAPTWHASLRRMPAAYVKESIVAPDAVIAAGLLGRDDARGLRAADLAGRPRPARHVHRAGRAGTDHAPPHRCARTCARPSTSWTSSWRSGTITSGGSPSARAQVRDVARRRARRARASSARRGRDAAGQRLAQLLASSLGQVAVELRRRVHPVDDEAAERHPRLAQLAVEEDRLLDRVVARRGDDQERRARVREQRADAVGARDEAVDHAAERAEEDREVLEQVDAGDAAQQPERDAGAARR